MALSAVALPGTARAAGDHDPGAADVQQCVHDLRLVRPPQGAAAQALLAAALASWGIALFAYLFQVPANRIGHTVLSVGELKIIEEVITLNVFVPFALLYLKEPLKLDYLWAGLCLLGAVFFMFRSRLS